MRILHTIKDEEKRRSFQIIDQFKQTVFIENAAGRSIVGMRVTAQVL